MIKTNKKYKDGSIIYIHDCKICNKENSAHGSKRRPGMCDDCRKERLANSIISRKPAKTHGLKQHRLYGVWSNMRDRCNNKNNKGYHNYGGRGISVCEEWNDFIKYKDHIESLENAYLKTFSLDRINNDNNYEPGNMRWASAYTQRMNQRPKKTNTGEQFISYKKNSNRFSVKGIKTFKTIEKALEFRKEKYGF